MNKKTFMTWQGLEQIKPNNTPLKTGSKSQGHSFPLQPKFRQTR